MMTKWKCALCVLLACLLLGGAACAEALPDGLQSLLDLTAAASLNLSELPETVSADGMLSSGFVYSLFTIGQKQYPELGLTPEMLGSPDAQAKWLEQNFICEWGELAGILWIDEELPRMSVAVTRAEFSEDKTSVVIFGTVLRDGEDLGLHVRMDARKDDGAACGWKVLLYGLDGVAQEESADALFTAQMTEFISPAMGFSVQVPALFADVMDERDNGVGGALQDGSATFYVTRDDNSLVGMTAESVISSLQEEHPGLVLNINEATGFVQADWTKDDGTRVRRGYYITESYTWMARIAWQPEQHPELEELSGYMMNSLSVDALGVG